MRPTSALSPSFSCSWFDHAVTFAVECAQRTDWKLIDRSVRVHPPPHWRGQSAQSLRQCHTSVPRYLRYIIPHPKCPAPDDRGGESPQSGGHPPQSHPRRFQISPRHRFTALNFLSKLRLRVALRPVLAILADVHAGCLLQLIGFLTNQLPGFIPCERPYTGLMVCLP